MDAPVIGIDLGTTHSLVGAVIRGKATLFPDPSSGGVLLPSVLGVGPSGELLVGRAARNRRLLDPLGTVRSIKRRMGEDVRVRLGTEERSPQALSALLLAALVDRAEAALGVRPTRAVITVPAYFDEVQRQATLDAGEIAGLEVERLVNEPTAAALDYETGSEELVLVYDLGGGTFDVSVLERDEGFMEVRASHGDVHLGGDDIDRALVEALLAELSPKDRRAVEADPRAMTRLEEGAERAKVALSTRDEVSVLEPFLTGEGEAAVNLEHTLTRDALDALAKPFIERTLASIDRALDDAGVEPADLERILLVGGASQMPIVATMVEAHLGQAAVLDDRADQAVALGAAKLAGRLSGEEVDEVLVDITPHTLVVGALDADDEEIAVPLIPRGTVVPAERAHTVYTRWEDQRDVLVPVARGDARYFADTHPLGQVRINDVPSSPEGSPVDIHLQLDLSGTLHVSATHRPSGRAATATIHHGPTQLTRQARDDARADVERLRAAVPSAPEADTLLADANEDAVDTQFARALLARAERALRDSDQPGPPEERVRAEADALEAALRGQTARAAHLESLTDALLDLE